MSDHSHREGAESLDDELIAQLRQIALDVDAPPTGLVDAARAAFGMSRLDEELAELLHDSASESAGVRSAGDSPRLVSFGTDQVGADVEITAVDDTCTVTGLASGPVIRASLQTPQQRLELELDQHGRFRVEGVTGAAFRLELTTESGYTVVTPWVRAG